MSDTPIAEIKISITDESYSIDTGLSVAEMLMWFEIIKIQILSEGRVDGTDG